MQHDIAIVVEMKVLSDSLAVTSKRLDLNIYVLVSLMAKIELYRQPKRMIEIIQRRR